MPRVPAGVELTLRVKFGLSKTNDTLDIVFPFVSTTLARNKPDGT